MLGALRRPIVFLVAAACLHRFGVVVLQQVYRPLLVWGAVAYFLVVAVLAAPVAPVVVVVVVGPVEGPWGFLQVVDFVLRVVFRVVFAAFGLVVVGGFGLAVRRWVACLVLLEVVAASPACLLWLSSVV